MKGFASVWVFAGSDAFADWEALERYIEPVSDGQGKVQASALMREVGLQDYEPDCIEADMLEAGESLPLAQMLEGASYGEQWLHRLPAEAKANVVICVFSPNRVSTPEACTLSFIGQFSYIP